MPRKKPAKIDWDATFKEAMQELEELRREGIEKAERKGLVRVTRVR